MKTTLRPFSKLQNITLVLIFLFSYQIGKAQVVGPGDWSSLRLYGHAFNVNGFSDTDYEWIQNHNYLFTTEKRHARNIYGDPSSEQGSAIASAQIDANNPECKPLFYWNASVIYDGIYESISADLPNNQNWIGADGRWNYSNASFRNWWVDVASDQINNKADEGVFIDAVPNVYATNSEEDYAHFLDMMDELPGFVIYNGFYTSKAGRLLAGLETLEHADGVYVETFFHYNCDTPDKGKQMLDALLTVPADKYIITNNLPEEIWNSTDHQFGMAAHLIIANENSFHRYYTTGGYDQSQLTIWHEDFGKYIGKPEGKATVNGYVYTRSFENAEVMVDLQNKTSSIEWGNKIITATESNETDLNISFFPNPTAGNILFSTECNYQISDALGNIIAIGFGNSVNISDQANGLYFVKILNKQKAQVIKLVKE